MLDSPAIRWTSRSTPVPPVKKGRIHNVRSDIRSSPAVVNVSALSLGSVRVTHVTGTNSLLPWIATDVAPKVPVTWTERSANCTVEIGAPEVFTSVKVDHDIWLTDRSAATVFVTTGVITAIRFP